MKAIVCDRFSETLRYHTRNYLAGKVKKHSNLKTGFLLSNRWGATPLMQRLPPVAMWRVSETVGGLFGRGR